MLANSEIETFRARSRSGLEPAPYKHQSFCTGACDETCNPNQDHDSQTLHVHSPVLKKRKRHENKAQWQKTYWKKLKSSDDFDREDYNNKKRIQRQVRTFRENIRDGKKPGVKRYIESLGKDILDKPDIQGWTPFMDACMENETHIVVLLAEHGFDMSAKNPNHKDMNGWDLAIMSGNIEVFDLLVQLTKHEIQPIDYEYCKRVGRPHKYGTIKYPELVEQFKIQRFRRAECEKNRDLIEKKRKPIAMSSNCTIAAV